MSIKKLFLAVAGIVSIVSASLAQAANPAELRSVRIPGSMCHPMGNPPEGLILSDGFWRFSGTGTATLSCPIPVSEIRASTDAPGNYIESIRFMYRDSDGAGTNTQMYVEVRSLTQFANSSHGYFDSNSINVSGLWSNTFVLPRPVIIRADQYMLVRVMMMKGPDFGSLDFYGISFP